MMGRVRMSDLAGTRLDNTSNEIIDLTGDSPIVNSVHPRTIRSNYQFPSYSNMNYNLRNRLLLHEDLSNSINLPQTNSERSDEQDNSFIQVIEPDEARPILQLKDINCVNSNEENSAVVPCINDSTTGQQIVLTCPICFEPLTAQQKPMATSCGHVFCATCLKKSLRRHKNKTCAKCNTPIHLWMMNNP